MTKEQLVALMSANIAAGMIANDRVYKHYGDNEIVNMAVIWARTIAYECGALYTDRGTWKETAEKPADLSDTHNRKLKHEIIA